MENQRNFGLISAINFLAIKPLTFTLGGGAVVIKKTANYAYENSEIARELDNDGNFQLLRGEGNSQSLVVDKAFTMFSSKSSVTLTKEEMDEVEKAAKEIADQVGAPFEGFVPALKVLAIEKKKQLAQTESTSK